MADAPVTGDLSFFVNVSFFTNRLKTEEVKEHDLRTADTANRFSDSYGRAIAQIDDRKDGGDGRRHVDGRNSMQKIILSMIM